MSKTIWVVASGASAVRPFCLYIPEPVLSLLSEAAKSLRKNKRKLEKKWRREK